MANLSSWRNYWNSWSNVAKDSAPSVPFQSRSSSLLLTYFSLVCSFLLPSLWNIAFLIKDFKILISEVSQNCHWQWFIFILSFKVIISYNFYLWGCIGPCNAEIYEVFLSLKWGLSFELLGSIAYPLWVCVLCSPSVSPFLIINSSVIKKFSCT